MCSYFTLKKMMKLITPKGSFLFQEATGGIESVAYKKLIAPFKNELPTSHITGFRRACADHKYAYHGPKVLAKHFSMLESCQLVPLPEASYMVTAGFIISKNVPYKGLINWR
jgi:hypothetical protein